MAVKMSVSLVNLLMGVGTGHGDFKHVVDTNFMLMIYGGPVPATASAALSGNTLLCTVADAGDAGDEVSMAATISNGILAKLGTETWAGTNVANGTATFYRFQKTADDGAVDTGDGARPRVQGTVGLTSSGADIEAASVTFVSGATFPIATFTLQLPPT